MHWLYQLGIKWINLMLFTIKSSWNRLPWALITLKNSKSLCINLNIKGWLNFHHHHQVPATVLESLVDNKQKPMITRYQVWSRLEENGQINMKVTQIKCACVSEYVGNRVFCDISLKICVIFCLRWHQVKSSLLCQVPRLVTMHNYHHHFISFGSV